MYEREYRVYDAVYDYKDYAGEAQQIHSWIQARRPEAKTLLDVACGTGRHLAELRHYYECEGTDLSPGQLSFARKRLPGIPLHEEDMTDFDLGRQFDAVTCLFSAIGAVKTPRRMKRSIAAIARHLEPGGVLVLEPWFHPDTWKLGGPHVIHARHEGMFVTRMNFAERVDNLAVMNMHYLLGTKEGIEYFTERMEFGLFTHEQYLEAFEAAGLEVEHDPEGLIGRGVYIGLKPAAAY